MIPSNRLCILISVFRPLMFKIIIYIVEAISTILLVFVCCLCSFFYCLSLILCLLWLQLSILYDSISLFTAVIFLFLFLLMIALEFTYAFQLIQVCFLLHFYLLRDNGHIDITLHYLKVYNVMIWYLFISPLLGVVPIPPSNPL